SFLQFLRIGDGPCLCSRIRSAREHADEHAVLPHDQVEHVADGTNALAGLPLVLARHNARESGEFVGKRPGIFSESGLHSGRLRLRQRHHQSDYKRAHSVLSQNLLHVELLYVTTPARWTICREEPAFAGKVTCGFCSETSGQSWRSNTVATDRLTGLSSKVVHSFSCRPYRRRSGWCSLASRPRMWALSTGL